MAISQGGWRWVHGILGVAYIVVGVLALLNPWDTFVAMAALVGWVLVFKGTFDVVVAQMMRHEHELWWLQLIVGAAEIGLAFWAAGCFGRKVVILIAFVGAWALMRGIIEIITAFAVRSIHTRAEAGTRPLPSEAAIAADVGAMPPAAPA